MIIWGTRTKREGRGFLFKVCPACGTDRLHFVAESKTKFTLYFVPTFTTSTKALLICTECERQEEFAGAQASSYLQEAQPRHLMLDELKRRERGGAGAQGSTRSQSPGHSLAVAMVVLATQVSLTDGSMDEAEVAAIGEGFSTIYSATTSAPVKQAVGLVIAGLGELLEWINSPSTGPIPLMLADAGRALRQLPAADQSRYIGQVAWLCESVAAASGGVSEREQEQMDSGFSSLGCSVGEVAAALAFCDRNGG